MPRKRSRSNTEAKFLNAVMELVALEGCGALGINAIAHQAGADKVLIYRYFKNLEGLLQRVADNRQWLPSVDELCATLTLTERSPATPPLHQLSRLLTQHIRSDRTLHQVLRWRKAAHNPLTQVFSSEWTQLWHDLADYLSTDLDYKHRETWKRVATLTALTVEAELCNEPVHSNCIDHIAHALTVGRVTPASAAVETGFETGIEEPLPTNLL